MARHVQLNSIEHGSLRVRTERSATLGDAVMAAPVFPHEFRRAQNHYPLVFTREARSGRLRPVALFGLEQGENLFLTDEGWDAPFVPAALRMQPFLIGRDAEGGLEVHVDLDHARVTTEGGEAVFTPAGDPGGPLREATETLSEVAVGDEASLSYAALLDEMSLIEPFTLDLTLGGGERGRLAGYLTINEERLAAADAAALARLQEADALLATFMMVASVGRLEDLARRRAARRAGSA